MTNVFGFSVDSGDFATTMDRALTLADVTGFEVRRAESEARGKLRGLGFAYHIKATGGPPHENVDIRFEQDGRVSLITGTQTIGQGHETTFPQILADRLGIPNAAIRLRQGDTDLIPRAAVMAARAQHIWAARRSGAPPRRSSRRAGGRGRHAGGGGGRHTIRRWPFRRRGHQRRCRCSTLLRAREMGHAA